jgi:uncharacterized protein (TIGR03435 family)
MRIAHKRFPTSGPNPVALSRPNHPHPPRIIKTPVLNKSGIEGRYDLTLSFSGIHILESLGLAQGGATPKPSASGGDKSGGDAGEVADPGGVPVMMQDAVAKQLGLKLVLEKRPIPALVIDHIEENPTEN